MPDVGEANRLHIALTSKCWTLCASNKYKTEEALDPSERDCFKHCAHRYYDVLTLVRNNMKAQFLDTGFDQ